MEDEYPSKLGIASPHIALVEPNSVGAHNPHMPKETKIRPEEVAAIAARLRALRATTGLSQEAFAEKYGLGYKQWGNFEAARGRIGLDAALTLARELLVPLDWTYRGVEAWLPADLRDKIRAEIARAEAIEAAGGAPKRGRPSRAS